jgi:endonuclease YncB( thermonuclease family)
MKTRTILLAVAVVVVILVLLLVYNEYTSTRALFGQLDSLRREKEYDKRKRDKYGRLLCYVYLANGTMVNELLVREGHAVARQYPPNVKHQERLRAAGERAKRD